MKFRPIFIAGCDRSGTTMLGDMLGAAPCAFATPESQWVHEFLMLLHLKSFSTQEDAANWLRGHFRFAVWELQASDKALASLILLDNPRETIENLVTAYYRQHNVGKALPTVWIDHTPDNFKHYGVLRHYFPEASFVHIVRDGRAVYHSIRKLAWGPNNAYAATRYWATRLQQALAVELAEGDNCTRVRYEDILTDPQNQIVKLCLKLELPFQKSMLNGGGLLLPGFTRSQHQLVGQSPDASRINSWRNSVNAQEISEFEAYSWSRTLLQTLGYALETEQEMSISMPRRLYRYMEDMGLYFINRMRHRRMEAKALITPAGGAS